jgi:hypothetical protein
MSYIKDLILSALSICHEGSDLCLGYVLLHCFDIVEMHCPNRGMRLSGLSQYIPDYIDIGDDLYSISC